MIYPPTYLDPGMGSWLSSAVKSVAGIVVGKGNTPGTPETRKYGYSPTDVAAAVTANLEQPQAAAGGIDPSTGKMILLGGAGVVLLIALLKRR